jgi:NAD(P)-dependent dehydrogenase (short-subunit alcohol dehydrogenase family)
MSSATSNIIISASSDIGAALCRRWLDQGSNVFGTFRNRSEAVDELEGKGAWMASCDLSNSDSIQVACSNLKDICPKWDTIVMCPGLIEPVGPFAECDFDEWEDSFRVNFTGQLRIIHELLPSRNLSAPYGPCILLFAGGGTNNATLNYSSYTVSKIALIKMCELMDAEVPDTRFVIIGPGWVKTKIHESTLRVGEQAGENYWKTIEKLQGDECTPMNSVLDCCDWAVGTPREVIGGRNFSVVHDEWNTGPLAVQTLQDPDMYKLRRHGNAWISNGTHRLE